MRIRTHRGLFPAGEGGIAVSCRKGDRRFAAALQPADHALAQPRQAPIPAARIVDDVGAIEGRAEHRRFRDLAAIAAADAAIVDRGDRIVLERIVGVLHRQRRAAGEPDTGVVAGADVLVDAEALLHHALARLDALPNSGRTRRCLFSMHSDEATMIFGPFGLGRQRLAQRVAHLGDVIGAVDLPDPVRADALDRIDDANCWSCGAGCRRATTGCPARRSRRNKNCRR